ncbi:hypothetical protein [Lentzea roselyniae]|uniref:hypothetical protein n=1 Tax=Lentzea roselyniae TaxID=531940 RepID=UPI0031F98535
MVIEEGNLRNGDLICLSVVGGGPERVAVLTTIAMPNPTASMMVDHGWSRARGAARSWQAGSA